MKKNLFILISLIVATTYMACDVLQEAVNKNTNFNTDKLLEYNLWNRFNKKSPISTTFEDAIYEAEDLSDFEPEPNDYRPLDIQKKASTGGYILKSGLYSMNAKSFCLRGYTHGPSRGDGHLYAPLKGKKSDLIQAIITRYGAKPDIEQRNIQVLLWAIIAGADMNSLGGQHSKTLSELFTVQELLQFQGKDMLNGFADKQINELKEFTFSNPRLKKLFEADTKIRNMVKRNRSYQEIEKVAILAGVAPKEDMIREVSKGRWSYHPDGFFIRFFPNGYPQTRVDVYVPYEGDLDFDRAGKPRRVRNNSPVVKEVVFNPATMVASPANQSSQRIGVSPNPVTPSPVPPTEPEPPVDPPLEPEPEPDPEPEPSPPIGENCLENLTGFLYPVIPTQEYKGYKKQESYRKFKPKEIDKFHYECKVGSPSNNNNTCITTFLHYRKEMYSYYLNDAGEYVKGYWTMDYREDEDNMGTLLAKGHTIYPKENSKFDNDFYVGSTYKVPVQEFDCIEKIDSDYKIQKIKMRQNMVDAKKFSKKGYLYIRKKNSIE